MTGRTAMRTCAGMLAALVAAAIPAGPPGGSAAAAPQAPTKEQAIQETLAAIRQELQRHGGSWEKWAAALQPYRDDIRGCVTNWQTFKWPWLAKNGYVFQGAAIQVHLRDDLEDLPEGERPLEAILHFDRQLRALGTDLLVALIPSKLSIHPDYLYAAVENEPQRPARAPEDRQVSVAVKRLMARLLEGGVEVVDLEAAFRKFRLEHGDDVPLYYVRDGHFVNRGARLAAERIAERLKRYDFVQAALAAGNPYEGEKGSRSDGDKADGDLLFIKDKRTGGFYSETRDSPVLVAGDSHLLYNDGRAQVTAQIAHQIGMPVSRMGREGLSGEIPVQVAKDPLLPRRRVIILLYSERMLAPRPGRSKWPVVNLPGADAATRAPAPAPAGQVEDLPATGVVVEACPPPDTKAPYRHYLIKFYLKDLADAAGRPIGTGDGIVYVLAMHDRKVLPVAAAAPGQRLSVRLTSWALVQKRYGAIQTGILPTVKLELEKPLYWGEVPGQPRLSEEELKHIGEEDTPEARTAAETPAEAPAESAAPAWRLELAGAVAGKPLVVYVATRDGKPWRAFGLTPDYNKAVHDVDPSGLTIADGRAAGTLAVTINPDAWVPKDGKPVAGRLEVDARADGGKVAGTYKGTVGAAAVSGAAAGSVAAARRPVRTGTVELHFEDALRGGRPHERAVNARLSIARGAFARGTVEGFHRRAWAGRAEAMDLLLAADTLTGEVRLSVAPEIAAVDAGTYTLVLDGVAAGDAVAGRFKARWNDEALPGGTFYGNIAVKETGEPAAQPAPKPQPKPEPQPKPQPAPEKAPQPKPQPQPAAAAEPGAPATADERAARARAIKDTLAGIDADLKKYGGTWQAWGEQNQAYRAAASALLTPAIKWPWPAKHNFAFQGSAIKLLMEDTLDGRPEGERPFDAIAALDRQLKARGIDLVFVPLPDKIAIYGDYLEAAANAPSKAPLCTAVKHLSKRLLEADVEVVDLYAPFLAYRQKHGDELPLYYDRDSHWRNRGAQLAAERIAERLKRYDFVQQALAGGNRYSTQAWFRPDKPDDVNVVLDAKTGGRYRDDNGSPILIMGDSNLMMNMGPPGGHMPAHVGRHIGLPLAFVAPTFGDAPAKIRNQIGGKRVVIWAQIARTLMGKWPVVDLGPPSGGTAK